MDTLMSNCIFDILDDNNDELQYTDAELDRYYSTGHLNALLSDEELMKSIPDSDIRNIQEWMNNQDIQAESTNEIVLSQRLSQLSTKETTTNEDESTLKRPLSGTSSQNSSTMNKRIRTTDQQNENITESNERIPDYLLVDSQLFKDLFHKINKYETTLSINDIHTIALLKHRIGTLSIRKTMNETYLRSVTGTLLDTYNYISIEDRRVWPDEVQSLILAYRQRSTSTTDAGPLDATDENVQKFLENLLQKHIKERAEQVAQLEKELQQKVAQLTSFSSDINQIIDDFVQTHGLQSLEIKRDYKIATITYNFEATILERQYENEAFNSYQKDIAKRLIELRRDLEKSKYAVSELKQRIFYNRPTPYITSLRISTPEQQSTKSEFLNRDLILMTHKTLDRMCCEIRSAEIKYYDDQTSFDSELSQMLEKHRSLVKDQGMTIALLNLFEKSFDNVMKRFNDIYNFRVDYYLKYAYESPDSTEQQSQPMSLSSNFLLTEKHPFTDKELQLLNRGPSYVPLCQMYVPLPNTSVDSIVKAFYAPFRCQLTNLFAKYHINIALTMEIHQKSYDCFKELFSVLLPSHLQERAVYEKYLIHGIYSKLQSHNSVVLRTADNMNTFCLIDREDCMKLAQRYLSFSDDYTLLISTRPSQVQSPSEIDRTKILKDLINSMNELLDKLKTHKSIPSDQIKKLIVDATRVKLPYIQFLSDVYKDSTFDLVSFVVANDSATWKIANYIDQILRPFVRETLKSTTFRDEIDFMRQLHKYAYTERRLQPSTVFCSLKIKNFYAMDTHNNLIDTVGYFLQDHLVTPRLENLSIQTIRNLLYVFLHYNVFSFNDDVYRIDRGSPASIPLSETLSNIYIFMWQKRIQRELQGHNELFGRHKDQIFFTWNKSSSSELFSFVQQIRENVRTVRFDIFNGQTVPFMNISIENRGNNVYTCVLHERELQRYHLPYVNGHSKLAHSEWLHAALIRAVCCSSSVLDFHQERIYLEATYLVNGYSLQFVEAHVRNFFNYFHAIKMRYTVDEIEYSKFRQRWFDYMLLQHEYTDKLNKFNDCGQLLQLNYFYEYGPRCQFNTKFHQLWSHYFSKHPSLSSDRLKLQMKPKHYQTLNTLFCSQKLKNLLE